MPAVLRVGNYRFSFFAADAEEPPHVHVKSDGREAKYWLEPLVRLSKNNRFRPHELNEIERILVENHEFLIGAWHDYFGN